MRCVIVAARPAPERGNLTPPGAIFDLASLRPFRQLHAQYGTHVFTKPAKGVNTTNELNVQSIALRVPTRQLLRRGPKGASDPRSVVGRAGQIG